jgi:multiple RNA-binding domain-containing protein 1
MQMGKNPAKKLREAEDKQLEQPLPVAEAESDNEYEEAPSRKAKSISQVSAQTVVPTESRQDPVDVAVDAGLAQPNSMDVDKSATEEGLLAAAPTADDDDWLRQRTSRLLDLVDDVEVSTGNARPAPVPREGVTPANPSPHKASVSPDPDPIVGAGVGQRTSAQPREDVKESAVDLVHKTARIFVRNLAYDVNQEELHEYFGNFGEIEEVSTFLLTSNFAYFMMNPR